MGNLPTSSRFAAKRFNGGDMQQRENFEFSRHTVVGDIHANEKIGSGQKRRFRMTNLIGLSAGQRDFHRLKRSARKHFTESLHCHPRNYNMTGCTSNRVT